MRILQRQAAFSVKRGREERRELAPNNVVRCLPKQRHQTIFGACYLLSSLPRLTANTAWRCKILIKTKNLQAALRTNEWVPNMGVIKKNVHQLMLFHLRPTPF